jgi:predicted nucleic-acid-binding protein
VSSARSTALTGLLDTNVLVRHLTGDPPELAARATALLANNSGLLLTDVVAAECVYVLESVYELERPRVAEALRSAVAFASIATENAVLLQRALGIYEEQRIGFADAYICAKAEAVAGGEVVSFDRSIDRVATVKRREP